MKKRTTLSLFFFSPREHLLGMLAVLLGKKFLLEAEGGKNPPPSMDTHQRDPAMHESLATHDQGKRRRWPFSGPGLPETGLHSVGLLSSLPCPCRVSISGLTIQRKAVRRYVRMSMCKSCASCQVESLPCITSGRGRGPRNVYESLPADPFMCTVLCTI